MCLQPINPHHCCSAHTPADVVYEFVVFTLLGLGHLLRSFVTHCKLHVDQQGGCLALSRLLLRMSHIHQICPVLMAERICSK
jgi:hypothetical protein